MTENPPGSHDHGDPDRERDEKAPVDVSVIVFLREYGLTVKETLESLEQQELFDRIEVILADGCPGGAPPALLERFSWLRHLSLPVGNMPALKGQAIRAARADIVAILDPTAAAPPNWINEILEGLGDDDVSAVGGSVVLDGEASAANQAAYLFEYGAFNPPIHSGPTQGDLAGNSVAYRRNVLVENCADILAAEGFNKPFCHDRIRACGGQLVIRSSIKIRHLTGYRFLPFSVKRFQYGRCFGAARLRWSPLMQRMLYCAFAPLIPFLLMARHTAKALRQPANRRMLPRAWPALLGVCAFWGIGEWMGYWFGSGRSCEELY